MKLFLITFKDKILTDTSKSPKTIKLLKLLPINKYIPTIFFYKKLIFF